MGEVYKFSCIKCNYCSDEVYLGQGMSMGPELILGVCAVCKDLSSISINGRIDDCCLCQSKRSVTPVNHKEMKKRVGLFKFERNNIYECPKCKEFSLPIPEIPEALWD